VPLSPPEPLAEHHELDSFASGKLPSMTGSGAARVVGLPAGDARVSDRKIRFKGALTDAGMEFFVVNAGGSATRSSAQLRRSKSSMVITRCCPLKVTTRRSMNPVCPRRPRPSASRLSIKPARSGNAPRVANSRTTSKW
jgi:hypothetical protein